jgi:hypothetical protein
MQIFAMLKKSAIVYGLVNALYKSSESYPKNDEFWWVLWQ